MLYKIEIFDRQYNFIDFAPIERPNINVDFLTLEKTTARCVEITARKGNFAVITNSDGDNIYNGIVDDVDISESGITLTLQPLVSLFDCDVYFDRSQSYQIETFLQNLIVTYFSESDDDNQNIPGLTVATTSSTIGALNLKDNIHNLYDMMVSALSSYGIAVAAEINAGAQTLSVTIGVVSESATIESNLRGIVDRNIIIGDSYGELNKFTAVNEDNPSETLTYYLQPNGSISTAPTDRLLPVFFGYGFAKIGDDETFQQAAYDAAYSKLAKNKYNNLIEITAASDSYILPSLTIGMPVTVLDGSDSYNTLITGYSINGEMMTIIMGCVRADLTKKLLQERRNSN